MERKPWTRRLNRRLPLRYRDVLPEPLLQGPSQSLVSSTNCADASMPSCFASTQASSTTPVTHANIPSTIQRARQFFTTQRNKFGLFRVYDTAAPSHDPEEHISLDDVCTTTDPVSPERPNEMFYPYPNLNAFRLGDWYWNDGAQKSQTSFQSLLDIVGDPDFDPADVREVSWKDINRKLAFDGEWMDDNPGWERTSVSILVPLQPRRGTSLDCSAGPKEFKLDDFYHRNLVSVIREKLSNATDDDLFHYEPYVLKWQPGASSTPVNVYGELYASQAFIEANRELQSTPPEPGCKAPRHIVALMFSSDSTHLTSFGDAKLWPLYLFFGNESKYRRCKPTCHLSNHVAYFQTVSLTFSHCLLIDDCVCSFRIRLRNLRPTKRVATTARQTHSRPFVTGNSCTRNGRFCSMTTSSRPGNMAY
jgi:hypothetical protein